MSVCLHTTIITIIIKPTRAIGDERIVITVKRKETAEIAVYVRRERKVSIVSEEQYKLIGEFEKKKKNVLKYFSKNSIKCMMLFITIIYTKIMLSSYRLL